MVGIASTMRGRSYAKSYYIESKQDREGEAIKKGFFIRCWGITLILIFSGLVLLILN